MTIKISQLGAVASVQGNVLVPLVSNITGVQTTVNANVDVLKTFIVASTEANVTLSNTTMKSYVDGQIIAANAGVTSANLGMKGYVDSVANQSIYGNSNVKSYLTGGFDGSIMPSANVTYDLGSNSYRWRDLWLSGSTIYIGNANISVTNNTIQSSLPISSDITGNITSNNITSSNITITGNSMSLGGATLSVDNGAIHSSLPIAASITATNLTIQGTRIDFGQGAYIEESEVAGAPGTYGLALNSADDGIVGMNALDSNAAVTSSVIVSNVVVQINVANSTPGGNVLVWYFDQSGSVIFPDDTVQSTALTSTYLDSHLSTYSGNIASVIIPHSGIFVSYGNLYVGNTYVPTLSNSGGTTGQITYDGSYVYVCVGTNAWKRANLSSW